MAKQELHSWGGVQAVLAQARLRIKLNEIIKAYLNSSDLKCSSPEFEKILLEASTFKTNHFFKSVAPMLVDELKEVLAKWTTLNSDSISRDEFFLLVDSVHLKIER